MRNLDQVTLENHLPAAVQASVRWVYNLGPIVGKKVVVLGKFDPIKVETLTSMDPDLQIHCVEICADRQDGVLCLNNANQIFETDFFERVILKDKPMILTDRTSWGSSKDEYTHLFAHLTGRSAESLRYHLEEVGIDMKVVPKEGALLSIIDVVKGSKIKGAHLASLDIMGELVK